MDDVSRAAESKNGCKVGCSFDQCFEAEKQVISEKMALRNGHLNIDPKQEDDARPLSHGKFAEKDILGLALSGGGIRSASFSIGVMQAMERFNVLRFFHYLSTVSGGGFVGSALTWHSHWKATKPKPTASDCAPPPVSPPDPWSFAFGKPWVGARNRPGSGSPTTGFELMDWIRHQGDYLRPSFSLGSFSMALLVLVNISVSLAIYFACLTLAIVALYSPACWLSGATTLAECRSTFLAQNLVFGTLFLGAALLLWHIVAASFTWRTDVKVARLRSIRYRMRTSIGRSSTWLALGSLVIAGLISLVFIEPFFTRSYWTLWIAIAVALLGLFLLAVVKSGIVDATRSLAAAPRPARFRIILFAALLIYLSAGLSFRIAQPHQLTHVLFVCGITVLLGLIINTNYFGLHRFYRDRLTETFLPDEDPIRDNRWAPAWAAEDSRLSAIGGANDPGLYHLINTNVVINRHRCASWEQRGSDNFIFSHAYCGSGVTGWFGTGALGTRDATLGTAMAISGAAVNPATGGEGTMARNWFVTAAMRFLNLRLGYWMENPLLQIESRKAWLPFWPNFINPGLWHGLLGARALEDSAFLELTDGGHFDNTGIYELIRRKLRLIIVADSGADADYSFDDISNLMERVRADFGTTIEFLEDRGLDDLVPRSGGDDAFLTRLGFARRGHAVARIYYRKNPGVELDETGLLILIKPTIVAGLPHDIYNYRASHDTFPGQSTANQFFTERQLEAYRELGYQLTKRMIEDAAVSNWFPDHVGNSAGDHA